MPEHPTLLTTSNRILARLSAADYGLLRPHLEPMDLPLRRKLEVGNQPIEYSYFLESGVASVVANGTGEREIEVGLIGREGMTGLAIVMAGDRAPHETYMQLAGNAQRIAAPELRQAMAHSVSLHRAFLHYAHGFFVQTAQTAMANGRSKIEERLARWLLLAQDRVDGNELALTHEFLATMLGVRRPGVTVALNLLEGSGLIRANRGVITIVDREGLEVHSRGAYGAPEAEFHQRFG
jgi:CRP-like cAMP-binding protein